MKTKIKSVLILPDDSDRSQPIKYQSQPIAVRIRTEEGDLMTKRLRKLISDDRVVFASITIASELWAEVEEELDSIEPWRSELLHMKWGWDQKMMEIDVIATSCKDSLQEAINDDLDRKVYKKYHSSPQSIYLIQQALECRELLKKLRRQTEKLQIVKMYRAATK